MEQIKVGKFIQERRKAEGLTQRELAEKLRLSDKTISKWETGNGLPEVDLMLPLCALLHISVNELLSGAKLDERQYHQEAEQNIMALLQERAAAKQKIIMGAVIVAITLLAGVTLVLLSGLLTMPTAVRILLIAIALVVIIAGIGLACVLDQGAGVYQCPHCHTQFVPSLKAYLAGTHTFTKRKLTCPHCGKRSYCRKHLTKD